jgi:FKBP-type peptidyl-prolyl cis-trans isomerase FkpA
MPHPEYVGRTSDMPVRPSPSDVSKLNLRGPAEPRHCCTAANRSVTIWVMFLNRRTFSLLFLPLLCIAAGCDDNPTSASSVPGYSQTDIRPGTGAAAATGNLLAVQYTGWLFDASKTDSKGLPFDTSLGSTEPFSFTLGAGQVIDGWDQGLVGMRVGGLRRLVIPPTLAYGTSRNSSIPPNATLVFDIELVSLQ